MPQPQGRSIRAAVGAFAAAIALVALATVAGCSSGANTPKVTVTITPTAPTPTATMPGPSTPGPEADPPEPDPPDPDPPEPDPPSNPGGVTLTASKGSLAPADANCSSGKCRFVYLAWEGLTTGSHQVQCVTDAFTPNVWSDHSYQFDTASGERELLCRLFPYSDSTVWIVIDGVYESNHVDWD